MRHHVHRIFHEAYGEGPFDCYFCDEEVTVEWIVTKTSHKKFVGVDRRIAIHHIDHDDDNDAPSNLTMSHGNCHTIYHRQFRIYKKCSPGCKCWRHSNGAERCKNGCTCGRHKGRVYAGPRR